LFGIYKESSRINVMGEALPDELGWMKLRSKSLGVKGFGKPRVSSVVSDSGISTQVTRNIERSISDVLRVAPEVPIGKLGRGIKIPVSGILGVTGTSVLRGLSSQRITDRLSRTLVRPVSIQNIMKSPGRFTSPFSESLTGTIHESVHEVTPIRGTVQESLLEGMSKTMNRSMGKSLSLSVPGDFIIPTPDFKMVGGGGGRNMFRRILGKGYRYREWRVPSLNDLLGGR